MDPTEKCSGDLTIRAKDGLVIEDLNLVTCTRDHMLISPKNNIETSQCLECPCEF